MGLDFQVVLYLNNKERTGHLMRKILSTFSFTCNCNLLLEINEEKGSNFVLLYCPSHYGTATHSFSIKFHQIWGNMMYCSYGYVTSCDGTLTHWKTPSYLRHGLLYARQGMFTHLKKEASNLLDWGCVRCTGMSSLPCGKGLNVVVVVVVVVVVLCAGLLLSL
jgi:hypothetical protein